MPPTDLSDAFVVRQYEERLQALKTQLGDVSDSLPDMELENLDDLCISLAKLEKMVFDCALALKRLLSSHPTLAVSALIDVRLPKLDAPIFDGKPLAPSSTSPYMVDPLYPKQRNWLTCETPSKMARRRVSLKDCRSAETLMMKPLIV
jgi:hypothetical protein